MKYLIHFISFLVLLISSNLYASGATPGTLIVYSVILLGLPSILVGLLINLGIFFYFKKSKNIHVSYWKLLLFSIVPMSLIFVLLFVLSDKIGDLSDASIFSLLLPYISYVAGIIFTILNAKKDLTQN